MMDGCATYEVRRGARTFLVRIFGSTGGEPVLSRDEEEALDAVMDGFCEDRFAGKVGYSIDPFKAAETILAEHYGYAKMVEADYDWWPNRIRY